MYIRQNRSQRIIGYRYGCLKRGKERAPLYGLCMTINCFSLQTNLGPVLIAVNSFDQAQSKTGLLQSASDNWRLQKIIQTVTSKLANSFTPQVIVLR